MKYKLNIIPNKTLFSDKQVEMICDKFGIFLDALILLTILIIPAIVIIVAIIWGNFK